MLPYELAASIAGLLPSGGDYPLVRRHRQEQRGRWRVRSLAAGVLQSLVPKDPEPVVKVKSRAAKVKVRTPRGGGSADAGVAAAQVSRQAICLCLQMPGSLVDRLHVIYAHPRRVKDLF